MLRVELCIPVIILSLAASCVTGAEPDKATHPCAVIEDAGERLGCYDEAFPRPADAPARKQEPAAVPATDPARFEEFGLSEAQLRDRQPDSARANRVERIEATVVGLGHRATGERIIRLDNGQLWVQTEVTVRGPLAEGDEVVIRRAALGTFMLVTPGRVALRVRRLE